MHPAIPKHPAIENLRQHQRQLDADGCEVGVSRQAVDETLALTDGLADALMDMMVATDTSICSGAMLNAYHKARRAMDALRGQQAMTTSVHQFRPHSRYPHFCDACGYGPGEALMHVQG